MGIEATYRNLLEAVSFAAQAHRHQLRKDGQTPYVGHVYRVCLIMRHIFGIDDPKVLATAALHDTIEDTTTDCDDLIKEFGPDVAAWVSALSKDKRLPDDEREAAYMKALAESPWQVKVCKLADIFDNLMDSIHTRPEQQRKSLQRAESYLKALQPNLPEPAKRPYDIVVRLFQEKKQAAASACPGPG